MAITRCVELYYQWFHAVLHRLPKIAFSILDTQFILTQPQLQSAIRILLLWKLCTTRLADGSYLSVNLWHRCFQAK